MGGVGNATPQVREVRPPPTDGHKVPFINAPDQRKTGDDIPPIMSLLQARHPRRMRHTNQVTHNLYHPSLGFRRGFCFRKSRPRSLDIFSTKDSERKGRPVRAAIGGHHTYIPQSGDTILISPLVPFCRAFSSGDRDGSVLSRPLNTPRSYEPTLSCCPRRRCNTGS